MSRAMLRGRLLLVAGALLGLLLAASDLVERAPKAAPLGDDVVALVGGRPILRADYERALTAVALDRREGALTPNDPQRVLDRLIDEELLVQRAIELGLAERDRRIRANLTSAVITMLTQGVEREAPEPTDALLRAFYNTNADWFRTSPRLHLEQLFFRASSRADDDLARQRAMEARSQLLEGAPIAALEGGADQPDVTIGSGPVSLRQLRDSVGLTVARAVADLEPGTISQPLRSGSGYHVVHVIERIDGDLPAFDTMRDVVQEEYLRRAGERELRRFLEQRRLDVDIQLAEDLR